MQFARLSSTKLSGRGEYFIAKIPSCKRTLFFSGSDVHGDDYYFSRGRKPLKARANLPEFFLFLSFDVYKNYCYLSSSSMMMHELGKLYPCPLFYYGTKYRTCLGLSRADRIDESEENIMNYGKNVLNDLWQTYFNRGDTFIHLFEKDNVSPSFIASEISYINWSEMKFITKNSPVSFSLWFSNLEFYQKFDLNMMKDLQ